MKKQKYGIAGDMRKLGTTLSIHTRERYIGNTSRLKQSAVSAYRTNRENGIGIDSPKYAFPNDGKYTWTKGHTPNGNDHYIYGDKMHDGYYREVRYDEGPGDRKWMEEKDGNYLMRLEKEGTLQKKEPEEYKRIMMERQKEEERRKAELEKLQEEKCRKKEAETLYEKGQAFYKNGEYTTAIIFYDEALKYYSDYALAKQDRLIALKALGKQMSHKDVKEPPTFIDKHLAILGQDKFSTKTDEKLISTSYIIPFKDIKIEQKTLGQGAFGVVYKGTWQYTAVAVKQLHMINMTENSLLDFKREAETMSKLTHPNLIRLYGVCLEPNHYSIITEFMPNKSLYDYLHSTESLAWPRIWSISINIGAGILHLHEKKILHRDLKSLNVLLNDKYTAKICDFGLSRLKQETKTTTKIPQTNQSVGTVQWMAPELFKRGANYTEKSDVYSCGMIFWEMVTRKVPWADAADASIIIDWVKSGEKEEIPKNKCPPSYAKLISKCWEQRAEDRPTVKEILKTLETNKQEIVNYKP